jgi:pentalenic acid synthase
LQADRSLIPNTVEEMLRYIPLFQISPNRVALEDLDLGDVVVRAGEGIIIPSAAVNRDPNAFPDPEIFDIRRDAGGHVAFAFGVHQCLGQSLARLELQIVFDRLGRIPNLRLAVPAESLGFRDYLLLSLESLPVTWQVTDSTREFQRASEC